MIRTRNWTAPRLPSLVAVLLLASAAVAQPAEEEYTFGELVEVQRVNVEVWVTDARGNPVIGLTADDFEVYEDGKPVEITNFSEVGAADMAASVREAPTTPLPPRSDSVPWARAPGHWVLYFDQLHMNAINQKRYVKEVRRFLRLGSIPAERVLIVRQSDNLFIEASFGSTGDELDRALDQIAGTPLGVSAAQEKRLTIDRLDQLWQIIRNQAVPSRDPCDAFAPQAITELNRYARQTVTRIGTTLDHLNRVAAFLAGLEGVKTLVYAGDALETHPGTDLIRYIKDFCPFERETATFDLPQGLGPSFRAFTRDANTNQVTVYTLQTSGLRTDPLMSAKQRARDSVSMARNVLGPAMREADRSGLEYLALETGGEAILNRNRFEGALDEIAQDMSAYYSLAYEPPTPGDGLEHRIEVRMKDRRLKARHRLNYRDKSPDERIGDRLQSALYLGISTNPLEMRLGAGELTKLDPELYALRLHLLVPSDRVAFLPAERPTARLDAQVASRDLHKTKVETVETDFRVPQPPGGDASTLDLVVTLELREGTHVLAVALRDLSTNEASYVSTTVSIGPPPATADGRGGS